jgi:hypothetical protein
MNTEVGGMRSFAASFDGVMLRKMKSGKLWKTHNGVG